MSARTLCPPERRVAEVTGVRRLGAYDVISARDLAGPPDPRPGQFYMLAAGDRWGGGSGERPYLPRAFSFARAHAGAGGGADLQFLLEDVGPGTRRLAELQAGEALMLLGPLGAGFEAPRPDSTAILVAGGIGSSSPSRLARIARWAAEAPLIVVMHGIPRATAARRIS